MTETLQAPVRNVDGATLPAATLTLIRQFNQLDQALYSEAQTQFQQHIQQRGVTFQSKLALFRLGNRLYQTIRTHSVRAFLRRQLTRRTP